MSIYICVVFSQIITIKILIKQTVSTQFCKLLCLRRAVFVFYEGGYNKGFPMNNYFPMNKTLETSIKTSIVGYLLITSKCFKLVSQMNEMYLLNQTKVAIRDRHQILLLILSKRKQISELINFSLLQKLSESQVSWGIKLTYLLKVAKYQTQNFAVIPGKVFIHAKSL